MRAATGMPTPKPTPRAVVLDFFAVSAAGVGMEVEEGLDVADVPMVDTEELAEDTAFAEEALADALDEDADEHEQAAGKWRAGDAAKATRFFNRAIDTYNEGLKKHPQSFDLAYNK